MKRSDLNLDLNENSAGCSLRVLEKLRTLDAREIARYPDREAGEEVAATFLGIDPKQLMLTNGVDEALHLLCQLFLDEYAEVLITDPTFPMYRVCGTASGATVRSILYPADFSFPAAALSAAISDRTRLILIANPNNPTGTAASREDLLGILHGAPHAAVVIDEAYFEFYGQTLLEEIAVYPSLFVTRTFSKAYGLAGLRLGVIASNPENIAALRRIASPFNINIVALACFPEALRDADFMLSYVAEVRNGRERLAKVCSDLGIHCWPSQANFLLVRIGKQVAEFVAAMRDQGVAVSNRNTDYGCQGCVRITIPASQDLPRLLECFEQSFRATSSPSQPGPK